MNSIPEIKLSLVREIKNEELVKITCSQILYNSVLPMFDSNTINYIEEMILVCFNRANKILGFYKLSRGGQTGTVCDSKVVFAVALNCGACGIALAHNHPSGNLKPSIADSVLTKKIKEAGKLLDVVVLDHLIVTRNGYYSMADNSDI